jgi:hypothetical protein
MFAIEIKQVYTSALCYARHMIALFQTYYIYIYILYIYIYIGVVSHGY